MAMKRDLYVQLVAWKTSAARKPLVLRGARQVGKTYLLKKFGQQEYASTIYLNFENDPKLSDFFNATLQPETILENITTYLSLPPIDAKSTLIIFDEIQEAPNALNSLKYFQEDAPQYYIVAAGSLLGVKLINTKGFPVGKVNFLDLYPLSFFEFLDAIGKNRLRDYLMNITEFVEVASPIHQELLALLKKYMFIGGMPEAVLEYSTNNDILRVQEIQREILDAYVLDFAKHAPKEQLMKITQVWESIPSQLAKENKKFIFSALRKSARGREYDVAIQWLADAGLIHKSYNTSAPKLPLAGFANKEAFKVFLLDVGLLSAMSNIPAKIIIDDGKLFSEFHGAFTGNYVSQELCTQGYQSYYWTSAGIAEVDFVIEHEMTVFPLEVKAGASRKKKSLLVYAEKYKPEWLLRASLLNLRKDGEICNMPLYLISRFAEICSNHHTHSTR